MYKYKSGQISITDFGQPMGMHLNENNRWVKKAAIIPWEENEKRYSELFKSHKGYPEKPLRLELEACVIQAEYGYSDEEMTLQIQESPYLQYFCGYEAYDDSKPPFDSSSMVYFRKRLTPEILGDYRRGIIYAPAFGDKIAPLNCAVSLYYGRKYCILVAWRSNII